VSQLVRDNPPCDPDGGDDVAPVITELAYERVAPIGAGQKKSVGREGILGAQQAEAINQLANESIHRDQALGFQLAEGYMDSPAMADQAETIEGQVGALTDAHAGVAEQKEGVTVAIIAPQQFLLDEPVLVGRQRARQIMLQPGCVLPKALPRPIPTSAQAYLDKEQEL